MMLIPRLARFSAVRTKTLAASSSLSSSSSSSTSSSSHTHLPPPLSPKYIDSLLAGHVHIWWFFEDKHPPSLLQAAQDAWLVAPEDYYSSLRGRVASIQKERLLTKTLIRGVLSRYLNAARDAGLVESSIPLSPRDLTFRFGPRGKPYLATRHALRINNQSHPLYFNLTHTGKAMGMALSLHYEVGIDVERLDRKMRFDPLKMSKTQWTADEHAQMVQYASMLNKASVEQTPLEHVPHVTAQLMRHWVLKESFVKATGRGINAPPGIKGFSCLLDEEEASVSNMLRHSFPNASPPSRPLRVSLRYDQDRMKVIAHDPVPPADEFQFLLFQPNDDLIVSCCLRHVDEDKRAREKVWPRVMLGGMDVWGDLGGDVEWEGKGIGCSL